MTYNKKRERPPFPKRCNFWRMREYKVFLDDD
jgi:hypothetical protein